MSEATEFTIGSQVVGSDGACGELRRVVVNPIKRELTHLVVEPSAQEGAGRLVPIGLVEAADREIRLRCSRSEFHALEEAEHQHFLQGAPGQWGYGQGQMMSLPYFGLGMGMGGLGMGMGGLGMGMGGLGMGMGGLGMGMGGLGMGMGGLGMRGMGMRMGPEMTTEDVVPEGEVEVRRGERVHATDGEIGRIQGFVIDPSDHRLTHILLQEGHLWGSKEVAIPIEAVHAVDNGVQLNLTKDEVRKLPPADLADPSV